MSALKRDRLLLRRRSFHSIQLEAIARGKNNPRYGYKAERGKHQAPETVEVCECGHPVDDHDNRVNHGITIPCTHCRCQDLSEDTTQVAA